MMYIFRPTDLLKAKKEMIGATSKDGKRRKVADGVWKPIPKGGKKAKAPDKILDHKHMEGMSSAEKMRHAASVMSGKNLPESTYRDVPIPPHVTAKERTRLNASLRGAVPGDYFNGIPIDDMADAVRKEGFVLIQEDGTEWSGLFSGADGEAFIEMGKLSEGRTVNGLPTYKPVPNSGLRLTWHKMNTAGRYEVIKYIS